MFNAYFLINAQDYIDIAIVPIDVCVCVMQHKTRCIIYLETRQIKSMFRYCKTKGNAIAGGVQLVPALHSGQRR